MRSVPVVLLLAAVAVVCGVVLAALGRGGEMAAFPADYPPLALGRVTAADVALLQPPRSLWGYNTQATGEALRVIAQAVADRDAEIGRLRDQLARLQAAPPTAAGESGRDD
jgi:ABC-type transporter Mla subunit MlaD